jgi:hypothetical protein
MIMSEAKNPDQTAEFQMSRGDLEAIAAAPSNAVPNVQFFGKTAFTIENAPIPKSVNDTIGVEKTVTVTMKVRMDRNPA